MKDRDHFNNYKRSIFALVTSNKEHYQSKTIIMAAGVRDLLPGIENVSNYCGKILFNFPYLLRWMGNAR
jgi:thioredoxin reductase